MVVMVERKLAANDQVSLPNDIKPSLGSAHLLSLSAFATDFLTPASPAVIALASDPK